MNTQSETVSKFQLYTNRLHTSFAVISRLCTRKSSTAPVNEPGNIWLAEAAVQSPHLLEQPPSVT